MYAVKSWRFEEQTLDDWKQQIALSMVFSRLHCVGHGADGWNKDINRTEEAEETTKGGKIDWKFFQGSYFS
jgi:hypothetical protein